MKNNKSSNKESSQAALPSSARRVFFIVIIVFLSIIVLLVAGGLVALNALNARPVAAFYAVDEGTRKGILNILQATSKKTKSGRDPYEVLILDDSLPIKDAIRFKKIDILFSLDGVGATDIVARAKKKSEGFDESILSNIGGNVRRALKTVDGKVYSLPLLTDFYFEWTRTKVDSAPLIDSLFLGASDKVLLNTLGALVMSEGFLRYATLVKTLQSVSIGKLGTYEKALSNFFGDGEALGNAGESLQGDRATLGAGGTGGATSNADGGGATSSGDGGAGNSGGILQSGNGASFGGALFSDKVLSVIGQKGDVLSMTAEDVRLYMEEAFGERAYLSLGEAFRLSLKASSNYKYSYYETKNEGAASFCVPLVLVTLLSRNKDARNSLLIMVGSAQTQLSRATGLSPTNLNCVCRDVQSDDARYWVSSAAQIAPPLTAVAFPNSKEAAKFAAALRKKLKMR